MNKTELPAHERSDADVPGHWLLARMGKKVLRPGGLAMTSRLIEAARIGDADVVELAPGLGRTARDLLAAAPRTYAGVDSDPEAVAIVAELARPQQGRAICAEAADTGLESASADVVFAEAMLTMQGEKAKRAIAAEAFRLLRPGGRYAIHEMGIAPDDVPVEVKDQIRKELSRTIRVNARPLTVVEWSDVLREVGFEIEAVLHEEMELLSPRRVIADEGVRGAAKLVRNMITKPVARRRVLAMKKTFTSHSDILTAVGIVAVKR